MNHISRTTITSTIRQKFVLSRWNFSTKDEISIKKNKNNFLKKWNFEQKTFFFHMDSTECPNSFRISLISSWIIKNQKNEKKRLNTHSHNVLRSNFGKSNAVDKRKTFSLCVAEQTRFYNNLTNSKQMFGVLMKKSLKLYRSEPIHLRRLSHSRQIFDFIVFAVRVKLEK